MIKNKLIGKYNIIQNTIKSKEIKDKIIANE